MDEDRYLSLVLSRILSGLYIFVYGDTQYILRYPTISIKYLADIFAQEEYEKTKFNSWIQKEDIEFFLIENGLWTRDANTLLTSLEKQIEDYKVELYKNSLNPARIKQLRQKLNSTKKNYNKLFSRKHCLDHVTLEGYIDNIRDQYLLVNSIYDIHNVLIFKDIYNVDAELLSRLSNYISENTIDIETFRKLARSHKWKNYWICNKDNLFNKPSTELTEEQQTLILMTRMYDNAYEHPECPSDKIIEDDDMFDGWLIHQRRESERNKEKTRTEKMLKDKKLGNANEIFLVANSREEAEAIYNLNDPNNRNVIKERNKIIFNSKEHVKETQLPDVQRELSMKMNQQTMNKKR